MIKPEHRSPRAPASGAPLVLLALVLLLAACGREAQPRAARTPLPAAGRPTPLPPTTAGTPTPEGYGDAQSGAPASAGPTGAAREAGDPRALGDPNAPVTVIEYGDYQWPYCDSFVRETKPQLEEQYINTGKVYFLYRDFPLVDIHPGALLAAHVANCAGDQGQFWPMHDRLFQGAAERAWGRGGQVDLQRFLAYAQELELDVPALQTCVEANTHAPTIVADVRGASEHGIRSTPTFLINGKLLIGAQPYQVWRRVLDDLLAKT